MPEREERPLPAGGDPSPPSARTIDLAALTPALTREIASLLGPRGPTLLASPDRFGARERVALFLVPIGIFAIVAIAARGFAEACWPRQEPSWALLYALPLAPLAWVVVRRALWTLRAGRMPFAPGVYVLEHDVVIAHGPTLRIVPLSALAGVSAPRRMPLGGLAEITLWLEGEPAETCLVPALRAEELAAALERAREVALAPPTAHNRRRHDPLAELRRSSAWDRAGTARPRAEWRLALAAATPLAIALGALVLVTRNVVSDAAALASADVEGLRCYVEAGGAEAERVRADVLPRAAYARAAAAGDAASLGRYVADFPEGPDTPAARARWIEMEYASARSSAWSLRAFVARFPDAPQIAEARAALPRLALEEARRSGEADALAYVAREYAGTPEGEEARRLRHARFESALASLLARGARPETAAFLRALFAYLEAHEGPDVLVRFRTPSSEALRRFDAVVDAWQSEPVEPIAPSFSRRLSMQREALVFDRLNTAFEPLVPRDVMRLGRAANLPGRLTPEEIEARLAELPEEEHEAARARMLEDAEDESGQPEIRIDYEIVPTGAVYVSRPVPPIVPDWDAPAQEPDERLFAAFVIRFSIEMRVPGVAERHAFSLEVEPDAHVQVDGGEAAPTDATIYEVLATSAFDRLGEGLTEAFFGGSAADGRATAE